MSAASAEDELFQSARRITGSAERAAFLGAACGTDGLLRARLEALLAAFGETGNPLDAPPPGLDVPGDPTWAEPIASPGVAECPCALVGPYKLLEKIGEGG